MYTVPSSSHIQRKDDEKLSFADLPRELRDMVYGYLWSATPRLKSSFGSTRPSTFVLNYGDITWRVAQQSEPSSLRILCGTFRICYDDDMISPTPIRCGLPKWLQASKGICREGIEELRRKGIWSCSLEPCREFRYKYSALIGPASATKASYM